MVFELWIIQRSQHIVSGNDILLLSCHFLAVTARVLSLPLSLCLLKVFSQSLFLSLSLKKPTKRYVCHTFTTDVCQNRSSIVSRDTSFKSLYWLIEFVYEAFIHCQTFERQESQAVPRQSFPKVNTEPDMHTNAQKNTHYNTAPRGLGHPADSILFLLNGSCVTKDNLGSPWPGYLRGI